MAEVFYPFDAGAGDVVTETEWARMARLWRPTGVVKGEDAELAPSAPGGMAVAVAAGVAWIRGFYYRSDAVQTLTIAAADPFDPRIDRVVARLDRTANTVALAVLQGTAAAAPTAPALTQTETVWEVPVADVTVPANAAAIAAGNVDDVRPIVAAPEFRSGGDAPAEATGTTWVRQADGSYVPTDVVTAAEHTKALHDALGIDADTVDGFHGHAPTKAAHDALGIDAATLDGIDSTGFVGKALVDAAGDLIVGTGPDAVGRLAKGADGTVLKVTGGVVGWGTSGGKHTEAKRTPGSAAEETATFTTAFATIPVVTLATEAPWDQQYIESVYLISRSTTAATALSARQSYSSSIFTQQVARPKHVIATEAT